MNAQIVPETNITRLDYLLSRVFLSNSQIMIILHAGNLHYDIAINAFHSAAHIIYSQNVMPNSI